VSPSAFTVSLEVAAVDHGGQEGEHSGPVEAGSRTDRFIRDATLGRQREDDLAQRLLVQT